MQLWLHLLKTLLGRQVREDPQVLYKDAQLVEGQEEKLPHSPKQPVICSWMQARFLRYVILQMAALQVIHGKTVTFISVSRSCTASSRVLENGLLVFA